MLVGFDIGGTKTRVAWSSDGKSFETPLITDTPKKGSQGVDALITNIRLVAQGRPIRAIAGGIAGVLDPDHQQLVHAPNLSDWTGIPLVGLLSSAFHAPIRIVNDTAVVGLGEALFGAGKGERIVAYITISTGVGGCRFVDGQVDSSSRGFEPGHHILDWESGDTFESLASGNTNAARYQTEITQLSAEAWSRIARQAAVGLYNTALLWSPDCIVVGGSMVVKKIVIPFHEIEAAYHSLPNVFQPMPPLKKASLDSIGGLYGSLALASELLR